jgi:hypothetical protein
MQNLINDLNECFQNARSGFVKPWKLNSMVHTIKLFNDHGADMTGDRLNKYLHNCLDMEGVDVDTINYAQTIIEDYFRCLG